MNEYKIVYGGYEFFGLSAVALGYGHVFHGNETFNPGIIEECPGPELPAEGGAHGEPLPADF